MNYFNLIENRSLPRKITFKQVSLSSLGLVCFLQQGKRLSKIRKIRIWIWRTPSLNLNRVTVICMEFGNSSQHIHYAMKQPNFVNLLIFV